MTWTHGDIDGTAFVFHVDDGDIHVTGKVDHYSTAILISNGGSITIDGKVDNNSNVSLTATGDINIGGGAIDGGSTAVLASNGGSITIGGKLDGSSRLSLEASGNIYLEGKVDNNSVADMVSHHGSIVIEGKVDNNSNASLIAHGNVSIGTVGGGGDKKIDGNSHVDATSGGTIALGNKIDSGHASVDFKACEAITIGDKIDGGSTVRLWSGAGAIDVVGKIDNGATHVTFWPPGSLQIAGGIHGGAQVSSDDWTPIGPLCGKLPQVSGYWWQNWPQTFGYVSPLRALPRSLPEISAAIVGGAPDRERARALKAIGGGWSFTDASLPFTTQPEVNQVSTALRGAAGTQDLHNVLQGLDNSTSSPMDLWPEAVDSALSFSTRYDQPSMTQQTTTGAVLPGSGDVGLIDTRALASSLQCELRGILSDAARHRPKDGTFLFHVEAGITMADLDQLLDHQNPRMAIQATGGSPGATLAGTISTATHGGEFAWPLLIDRVRAIHLVGPGGEEWWVEGQESIADPAKLQARYPQLDAAHFIGGAWAGIPGLTAQDALNAVIVSMGTMGVIYSVVLEVVAQFGVQQIVTATNWPAILTLAGTTETQLRSGNSAANRAVLQVILDGSRNGTGIAMADNVYADLAINPFNRDCWITNRQVTSSLPVDFNTPTVGIGDYLTALNVPLSTNAADNVTGNHLLGRIFDFLGWATDIPANFADLANDATQALGILNFLTRSPDLLAAAVATMNVQAVANTANNPAHPDRGQQFLGDFLSGILGALQGTAAGVNSNYTGIAYQVGAIGWPAGGVPGRGIEVALGPEQAFTFLQTVLFDDVLQNTMVADDKPLIGYISIRICPPTKTLMGMQQYEPFSVMVEIVGYRSPEANVVMDLIQQKVLAQNRQNRLRALLHWGLENQQLTAADLTFTPLQEPVRPGSAISKLNAFKMVRKFLVNGNPPVFDNNFVHRLDL
jgi:hypothetical protein